MKKSMKSLTVAASAAGMLALGACGTAAPTTTAPTAPAKPVPATAPVAPATAPAAHAPRSSSPSKSESTKSNHTTGKSSKSTTPRTGYKNGLPGYMQCGVRCGDEPSSADIQSDRASSGYPTQQEQQQSFKSGGPGSDSESGAGAESTRQYQQWYSPGGPGSHGQLPGKITAECDATCARGN